MKYFTQPKNEPLLRKKRRPKEKAADFDLWMKEFTAQFIDVTFATGGEAPAAIEQFIDVTKATGGEAPGATEAVADEDGTLDALFLDEDPYGFNERCSFEQEQADKAALKRKAKWCNW